LALALVPGVLYALPDGAARDGSEVSHHTERGFAGEGRFDLPGGALLGLGVGLFLFGITQGQVAGFASFLSWGSLSGAALAASLLVRRTVSAVHSFVPPSLFENRGYVAAVVVAFLSMFANVSALVLVPLLVVAAHGLSTGPPGWH